MKQRRSQCRELRALIVGQEVGPGEDFFFVELELLCNDEGALAKLVVLCTAIRSSFGRNSGYGYAFPIACCMLSLRDHHACLHGT
jgi:hypothetical protein